MYLSILIFIFGAAWGSFFYTLALRTAQNQGNIAIKSLFSFSKCPQCESRINPLYMIPVIGYALTRGKCSKCGGKISVLYPVTEIFYGFIAIAFYYKYGINVYSVLLYLTAGLAISISLIDIKTLIVPGQLLIVLIVLSLYPVIFNEAYKENLYGLIFMALFFIVILLIFPGSFGGGDVKFASVLGFLLGIEQSILTLELALISGSLIGVIYALITKKGFKIRIAFAPYLTIGLIISLLYGNEIILIYFRIFY